jgi:hypothetical protein
MHREKSFCYSCNNTPFLKSLLLLLLFAGTATTITLASPRGEQQSVLDKRITMQAKDIPLKDCLDKIARAVDVSFTYTGNYVLSVGRVNLNVKNKKVGEVLTNLFKSLPLSYVLVDDHIVIRYDNNKSAINKETSANPEPPAPVVNQASLYNIPIRGVIRSAKGELLKGATILIKGTSIGTSTNEKGEFELKSVPENATLVITMVGYKKIEVKAKASLVITLEEGGTLDEVVFTGFQRINKKEFTGAAVTLKADEIKIDDR